MKKIISLIIISKLLISQTHIYKVKWYIKKNEYYGIYKTETIESNLNLQNFLNVIKAKKCKFIKYKIKTLNNGNIKVIPLFKYLHSIEEIKPSKIIINKKIIKNNNKIIEKELKKLKSKKEEIIIIE